MKKIFAGSVFLVIMFGFTLSASAAIVIPPSDVLPTTVEECKKGGWESYLVFKNQGDCVSFIATEGKNEPALLP